MRYQRDCPHHGFTEVQLLKKFYKGIDLQYRVMLDTASEGNFETRTPEEAKRLIENLVSSNSAKNLDMLRIKSDVKDDSKIVEAETGSIHEVSLVEQAIYQDKDPCHLDDMEFKLEDLLKDQLEMTEDMNLHLDFLCKELNGRLETLDTRVKMLYTQASQTAEAVRKQEALIKENAVEVERHRVDDILDNGFGEVLEQEKLEEDAFLVESSISVGSSYWCRPTPTTEHRSTSSDKHRSTPLLGSKKIVRI